MSLVEWLFTHKQGVRILNPQKIPWIFCIFSGFSDFFIFFRIFSDFFGFFLNFSDFFRFFRIFSDFSDYFFWVNNLVFVEKTPSESCIQVWALTASRKFHLEWAILRHSITDECDITSNRRRKQQMEGGKTSRPFSGPQDEKLFAPRRSECQNKRIDCLSRRQVAPPPLSFSTKKESGAKIRLRWALAWLIHRISLLEWQQAALVIQSSSH